MATEAISIRQRVMAASARIQRVKRLDRAATAFITAGGLLIIVGVLFMFLFILAEAWPMFRPAEGRSLGIVPLYILPGAGASRSAEGPSVAGAAPAIAPAAHEKPLVFGIDEYQMYLYEVLADARVAFFRTRDGSFAQVLPVPGLGGARITAASRSTSGDFIGAGTSDGRAALVQVRFRPKYEEQRLVDLELEVRERATIELDPARRPIREIDYGEREAWKAVAALVGDDEIMLLRRNEDEGVEQRETLRTRDGERVTHVRLGRTDALVATTEKGNLYFWELTPELKLAEVKSVASQAVTAVEWMIGGNTLLVGDAAGHVSAWFRVRLREEDQGLRLVRANEFAGQGTPVRAIGPSPRDRSFVTAGDDGSLVLRHGTSGRKLLEFGATGHAVEQVLITPKSDGLLVTRRDGRLARYEITNPHPEVSFSALFRRVWYEGYPKPEYVWQSTGATDDFEAKFSLVPLVFGTIKGTLYAMLFAGPLAVMAALYTSQFAHPTIRQKVKPTVEIMAALPSVVIGFVAGLWLASRVERHLVPVLLMIALLPAFGTAGVLAWERLPHRFRVRLKPGMELTLIVPLLLLGVCVAALAGPSLERIFFAGDFRGWLSSALGLVYDQRNSLVVGLAMGFAVIPIIFTISEDAFSSVPSHLTAASLALGASRWQTALRVVLPTASPGVFSAIMIGFGRAVGETMIVLMATGNTPVLDWSIFNGMRTLSANIAVEIPEAPHGGTLYRVLFLAALVLFAMTFVVNTVAELIRQRLRQRYRAL
jgi:phosphate transport system permease protein